MIKTILSTLFATTLAVAAGAPITTITCTAQVVTVTATAHGIAQYQGFSITGASVGTYNINSTAGTATANTFTFTLPASTPCNGPASGGTVLPAKQIVNIGSQPIASSGNISMQYVFWNTTTKPVPLVCNLGTNGTTCPVSAWSGASAAENAAIVAGTTVESVGALTISASTPSATVSAMMVTQYANVQASYTSGFLSYSGWWWNGAAWINQ
jgi:hypothetical protein